MFYWLTSLPLPLHCLSPKWAKIKTEMPSDLRQTDGHVVRQVVCLQSKAIYERVHPIGLISLSSNPVLILGPFWCSVVISIIFSSNLSVFKTNPKNLNKKNPKTQKSFKNLKLKKEKNSKKLFF